MRHSTTPAVLSAPVVHASIAFGDSNPDATRLHIVQTRTTAKQSVNATITLTLTEAKDLIQTLAQAVHHYTTE